MFGIDFDTLPIALNAALFGLGGLLVWLADSSSGKCSRELRSLQCAYKVLDILLISFYESLISPGDGGPPV